MNPLRTLAVLAIALHAVGYLALPYGDQLFAPESLELMRYAGHGALINPTHPVVYAFYLLVFPALLGITFGLAWGRYLFLGYYAMLAGATFFLGVAVSGPPETFVGLVGTLVDGAVLGLAFLGQHRLSRHPPGKVI